jgi:ribonuclease-3
MVATTLEAVVGAVFLDGGDEAAMRVIKHLGFLEHRFLSVTLHTLHCPP